MKHGTTLIMLLALVAGGCGKKSGDEKADPAAAKPTADTAGTAAPAPTATANAEPAAAPPVADPPPAAAPVPLSDEQCKDVVLAIVACRSSGDDNANVDFDDWLLTRFYGGTGIALLDPLQEEMDAWKKKPAQACADWRTWRAPEPFPDGAAIHAAAKAADCAKLRSTIDAAGGLPVPPDSE